METTWRSHVLTGDAIVTTEVACLESWFSLGNESWIASSLDQIDKIQGSMVDRVVKGP